MNKKVLVVVLLVLVMVLAVTVSAQAKPPEPLYFEKVCELVATSAFCDIQNGPDGWDGGTVEYLGPVDKLLPNGKYVLSSEVILRLPNGSETTGHFVWNDQNTNFVLRSGSGLFDGFHAQGDIGFSHCTDSTNEQVVACDDVTAYYGIYPLTGTYHAKN